jgi:hypothetical protein
MIMILFMLMIGSLARADPPLDDRFAARFPRGKPSADALASPFCIDFQGGGYSERAMSEEACVMCGPPRALIALLFAALLTATSAIGAPPGATHRVVAVGDLHGDFEAWRAIAQAAGIEGASGRWVGGATVFIQVGDVVDRGPASVKILQDLMRLQREAQKAGGRVIALVGNHEAMNMTHDLRYVSAGDYAAFTSAL